MAIVTGNTYLIKPSEKDPGAVEILADLSKGLWPDGVLNVVQGISLPLFCSFWRIFLSLCGVIGGKRVVDFMCDAPEVKAISFVGGGFVGNYIHDRGK